MVCLLGCHITDSTDVHHKPALWGRGIRGLIAFVHLIAFVRVGCRWYDGGESEAGI